MKTILLSSLFLLFSCLAPLSIFAAPVDEATAKSAALGWLNHTRGVGLSAKLNPDIESMDSFKDNAGDVLYYVINLKPDGYVVVSADDQIEPIITFSQTGNYDPNPENPLYVLLNKDMTGRNNYVKKELPSALKMAQSLNQADKPANVTHAEKSQEKWTLFLSKQTVKASSPTIYGASPESIINDVRVEKLVQSKWSQSNVAGNWCYNYYTPNNYVCGCVATAMAQLMRFNEHPVSGIGRHPFTVRVDGQWIENSYFTRGGDGNGGAYDWSNMPLIPADGATLEQRQMIGSLCYDAGLSVNMMYSAGISGAFMDVIAPELKSLFGYANAITGTDSNSIPPATISNMVNTNLDAGYPVIFGITGGDGGHAIVCDGYGYNASTMYHHLNMGWAGTDDQWYNLPNMVGIYANYNAVDTCIYNIFKTGTGEIVSGRVVDWNGDPISGATVQTDPGTFSSTTNEKGIYSLVHVTPGTYNITVTREGYTAAMTGKTVEASVESGSTGNIWGVNFTLPLGNGPPSVTTNSIGSFTSTSVFATGKVWFENGEAVTERGFCWGTSTDPLITGNKLASGNGLGEFSGTITGLTNNTRYYVRAYATNSNGTSYGENLTFKASDDTFPINLAIPAGWITVGWKVDETAAYNGNYSLSSGTTSDNSTNTLTYAGNFLAGTISFKYKVSSEPSYDYLKFYVDGTLKAEGAGEIDWTSYSCTLAAGPHILEWAYVKDKYTVEGSDKGWIDAVVLPPVETAGTIVFSSGTYAVAENAGTVTITASRTGGSTGDVSVQYATDNGTASAGTDYTAKAGLFTWSDGDTSDKTFAISITDDSTIETNENFLVKLSAANGVSLGAPNVASVTITDNDFANIVTSTDSLNVPEGGTATFQVKLSAKPADNVIVAIARSSGDSDISVSGESSLTFTTSNWSTYKTVTIAAAEDADNGNGEATISCTSANAKSKDVTVTEADDDFAITVNNDGHGTTVPSGLSILDPGNPTVSATPDPNYHFVNWTGSATFENANSATTKVIGANSTIQANFAHDTATLTMSACGKGETVPGAGSTTTNTATPVAIEAKPDGGSTFLGWIGGSGAVFDNDSALLTNVTLSADATVTANFVSGEYTLIGNGEQKTSLSDLTAGGQKLYVITVPEKSLLKITTSGAPETGDCDLYVKYGSAPTLTDYTRKSTTPGNNESIEINSPAAGIWYIVLQAYTPYSDLTLEVSYGNVPGKATFGTMYKRSGYITLLWGAVSEATSYKIFRSDVNDSALAKLIGTSDTISYKDPFTDANAYHYYYWVRAVNAFGDGEFSVSKYWTTLESSDSVIALKSGTAVTATGTEDSIRTFKLTVPTGQKLLEFTLSGGTGDCDIIITSPASATVQKSISGSNCEYVPFVNPANGDWTIQLHGATDYAKVILMAKYSTTTLAVPSGLAASDGLFDDRILLNWKAVPGATSYEVFRNTTKLVPVAGDKIAEIADNTYEDNSQIVLANPGTFFYYFVNAKNDTTTSNPTAGNSGFLMKAPLNPTSLAASDGTYFDKIRVSWTKITGATSYRVFRTESAVTVPNPDTDLIGETTALFLDDFGDDKDDDIVPRDGVNVKYYYYWIAAKNQNGTTLISSKSNAGFLSKKGPATITASNGTYSNRIFITWAAVPGATAYDVYRYRYTDAKTTLLDGTFGKDGVDTTAGAVLEYEDSSADVDTPYYYRVKAKYGAKYDSDFSLSGATGKTVTGKWNPTVTEIANDGTPSKSNDGELKGSLYFWTEVPAGTTRLVASLNGIITPPVGTVNDCDLFAKFANFPTATSFNAKGVENILSKTEILTVSNPAAGTWYFLLYGTMAYSGVTLTVNCYEVADIVLTQWPSNNLAVPFTAAFKGKVVDKLEAGIPNIILQVRNPITGLTSFLTKTDTKGFFSYSALINTEGEHTFDFFFTEMPDTAKGTASHTVATRKGCIGLDRTKNFFDFSSYLPAAPIPLSQSGVIGLQTFLDIRNGWVEGDIIQDYEDMWIEKTVASASTDTALLGKLDEGLYMFFYGVEGAGVGNDTTPDSAFSAVPFVVHVDSSNLSTVVTNLSLPPLGLGIIDETQASEILGGKIGVVAVAVLGNPGEGKLEGDKNIYLLAREQLELLANLAAGAGAENLLDGKKYSDVITKKFTVKLNGETKSINVITSSFVK